MSRSPIICLFFCLATQLCGQSEWKLVKEKGSTMVYTKKSDNSKLKEVKITARFQSSMNELVAALEDVDTHKDWVPYTIDSYMVDKLNEDKFYYYVSSDFPFPAKDRDVVILYEREQNPDTKVVITTSEAAPDYIDAFKEFIRVPVFSSTYILTPKTNGFIDIDYQVKVSPGGSIPAWIINLGITKGPIKTMESLATLLDSGKYRNVDVAGIVN